MYSEIQNFSEFRRYAILLLGPGAASHNQTHKNVCREPQDWPLKVGLRKQTKKEN